MYERAKVSSTKKRDIINLRWKNQSLVLLPERAIYWKEQSMLLLSDLHLGKAAHFRKISLPVPANTGGDDLTRLATLIDMYSPERVVFLGDLFHSVYNPEWEIFGQFVGSMSSVSFELVNGNHDILSDRQYEKFNLKVHPQSMDIAPFVLIHDPEDLEEGNEKYAFCGHLHPGVKLRGKGRQSMRLACFYFGRDYAILPAFGSFTGTVNLKPKSGDRFFAVTENAVLELATNQ